MCSETSSNNGHPSHHITSSHMPPSVPEPYTCDMFSHNKKSTTTSTKLRSSPRVTFCSMTQVCCQHGLAVPGSRPGAPQLISLAKSMVTAANFHIWLEPMLAGYIGYI